MISEKMRDYSIGFLTVAIMLGAMIGVKQAQALTSLSDIYSGDLIRGESFSAVYYMGADGFRYVFPNDKTYFTWYTDFDDVRWISDSDLAKIQIGGNVTYRPDSNMIKINTDPKVYYVGSGGRLYWVSSESVAISMYGSDWNKQIDDVPDGFFGNYTQTGEEISERPGTGLYGLPGYTINDDKDLVAPEEISITSSGYSPISATIEAGQTVRFTNNDGDKHTASADNLSWGTGTISPGGSYVQRFKAAGEYPFFDSYDSSNSGAIYVE
ncbi:hypothetical protein CO057_01540 [Candidatus Uhrbacteria bacterium CG_4_9_14_0_2_um_filter_41_50]|uniref:EfeO-type cupredoxin-like domain-containing protein n=1 Tax=Candidatus Uhrbacteria bacterium CG_4_9_14_0_2_um_filter_41_50 TaxID=1975031 RepID=A0A2M8EPL8_9BACT|nr:MAG: hypothetical protein COY24_02380 [Candidatus Uhrbacteria bacterium CG_4_10_14_0_2_um_filter_41_21]PJB84326.1 MAG: hypothetical protein CO086_04130 [Candidatus Uhrbacteria bacterium CG_4_9_14_0_8_um_filter_41_16]PJC24672.1 MAG: hypothetical protein CO057_01540 [Candidatus Uhrbacteria bacterium CG_4_9_14_0_2_um_filter_41_50]PJE75061.1 MAG: hypothetical protein COV03_02065 [Candidatus Uhrbacteria bacterium CG10_big_fil_rev_8_21_14_0_10_41_26]